MAKKIAPKDWRWFGCAGHFIAASDCQFRLHTRVGNYRISTVGAYTPSSFTQTSEEPFKEIGWGRKFETMVFKVDDVDPEGSCPGEGTVNDWGGDGDMEGYNSFDDAHRGHLAMCEKYASVATPTGREEQ